MATAYATGPEVRQSLRLQGSGLDAHLADLALAASDRIDRLCGRTFAPPTELSTIYYRASTIPAGGADTRSIGATLADIGTPASVNGAEVWTDDLTVTNELVVETSDAGPWAETWATLTATEYRTHLPWPGWPVHRITLARPVDDVRITGRFGWATVPAQVKRAAILLAARLYARETSPLGTVAAGGDLGDLAIRDYDADVMQLVQSYRRRSIG